MSDDFASKVQRAWSETGPVGVGRRASRVALEAASGQFESWSRRLLAVEAWERLSDADRAKVRQNAEIEGRHRGRRAFIVATGPSLKQQDLAPLADEITFGMNAFYRHPILDTWSPDYYLVTDGLFFDGSDGSRAFFEGLTERVGESEFFVPVQGRAVVEDQHLLPPDRTRYLAIDAYLPGSTIDRIDLTQLIPSPPTVLQTSIMAAIYMGCSPIYLLGADHSWLADADKDAHFYEGKTLAQQKALSDSEHRSSYLATIRYAERVWQGHEAIRDAARRAGVVVLNATAGGFLDVYPRVRYESVLEDDAQ